MTKDPLFDPRTCSYKLNAKIRQHVTRLLKSDQVQEQTKAKLLELMEQEESNKNTMDYESLTQLHKYIQWADPDNMEPFYMFIDSCRCIEPKPRQNVQLQERIAKLGLKNSQVMYEEMVFSVDKIVGRVKDSRQDNDGSNLSNNLIDQDESSRELSTMTEFKNLYGSAIAVFNSFLVIICTFLFCYKALEYSIPEPNVSYQAMFGLTGSLIVAIAEIYFLLRVV